jgi:hypothetical protein
MFSFLVVLTVFAMCGDSFKLTSDEIKELGGQNAVNDANGKWASFKKTHCKVAGIVNLL